MAKEPEVDPALLWRWVGESIRPWVGWGLAALGALAMILGYLGVSREVLVAKQLPFLLSGGLGGVALVFLGGVFLGTQDVRVQAKRLEELEELVADLHEVLLTTEERMAAGQVATPSSNGSSSSVVVLPTGSTYHRSDCSIVAGKKDAERVPLDGALSRGMTACKRCQPAPAPATTS